MDPPAGLIVTELGHQRGARAERRRMRREPSGAAAQDALVVGAPLLRDIPDGEPVEGPAHRVMIVSRLRRPEAVPVSARPAGAGDLMVVGRASGQATP